MRVAKPALLLACLLLIALVFGFGAELAEACPSCKGAVANDESGAAARSVEGYYYSILLMMTMPYLIIAGFAFGMYRLYRKSQKAQQEAAQEQAAAVEAALPG